MPNTSKPKQVLEESFMFKTRDDLMQRYHQKGHLVDDLVARKSRLGRWRWHPEFVSVAELMQYWVC
jgi:hypothetical protein